MPESLSQLALIAGLLTNWDSIRLRMGPISPALADELGKIAQRLQDAEDPGALANILDDLLDLTRETPAYSYVQTLVARSTVPETARTRDFAMGERVGVTLGVESAAAPGSLDDAGAAAMQVSRALGTLIPIQSGVAQVPIFFATNRAGMPGGDTPYGGEPAGEISYGLASVTIPVDAHLTGRVESPHWWTLFPGSDPEHRFVTLGGLEPLTQAAFATRLEGLLQSAGAQDLLVFLHGFNVTFEEGARRAAQIAYDMKFPGAVILFSWPSAGSAIAYASDEERAFASADPFAAFLKTLEGGPWRRVHTMAHSMGNRVLLMGLADNARPKLPLGQVVFAAADVYVALFREKFPRLQAAGRLPATSYASNRDVALRLSSLLHRGARVGLISGDPFVSPEMDTIDASAVDTGFLGHGYFAEKRSLITDIRELLSTSLSPADRGLTAAKNYWLFPR